MRHTSVLKKIKHDQGFTILELVTILVIVGILSALAAPSFLGWVQKQQIEEAITNVEGAIKEGQRRAISRSKACNIAFETNPPKVTTNDKCLFTGDRILENVELKLRPKTETSVNFNHKGETQTSVTITLTHKDRKDPKFKLQRCLVVSSPLGLIRKGENLSDDDDDGTGQKPSDDVTCQP